jgi:hypothetical protein
MERLGAKDSCLVFGRSQIQVPVRGLYTVRIFVLYVSFWVIPQGRCWMTKFSHSTPTCLWRWNSVPKRRHIKFICRGITQKKADNIQNMAKVWNQRFLWFLKLFTRKFGGSTDRPWAGQSYRKWSLHPPGGTMIVAVLKNVIKRTLSTSNHDTSTSFNITIHSVFTDHPAIQYYVLALPTVTLNQHVRRTWYYDAYLHLWKGLESLIFVDP